MQLFAISWKLLGFHFQLFLKCLLEVIFSMSYEKNLRKIRVECDLA